LEVEKVLWEGVYICQKAAIKYKGVAVNEPYKKERRRAERKESRGKLQKNTYSKPVSLI
jgi:hypothetical protein